MFTKQRSANPINTARKMSTLSETIQDLLQEISLEVSFASSDGEKSVSALDNALYRLIVSLGNSDRGLPKSAEIANKMLNNLRTVQGDGCSIDVAELSERYLLLEKSIHEESILRHENDNVRLPIKDTTTEAADDQGGFKFYIEGSDDIDLLTEFCTEGRELLAEIEQGILVLEEDPSHKETLNQIFRAFHTFKGGAGFLGLDNIKDLAHTLESLLGKIRQGELGINQKLIDFILSGSDKLYHFIADIEAALKRKDHAIPFNIETAPLIEGISKLLSGEDVEELEAGSIPSICTESQKIRPADADHHEANNREPKRKVDVAPRDQQVIDPSGPHQEDVKRQKQEVWKSFVKIKTERLDSLIDLVGELVIAKSMVEEHPSVAEMKTDGLPLQLRQLSRITSELQRTAMSLRMVPIRTTFRKMNRLVRDLATSQNKLVQLVLKGEDTELDRNIVDALADPLIHMLRNSIDHGLEMPEEREASGKQIQGKIVLEACHQGGGILIRVEDDGRGIDVDKVLRKAKASSLIDNDFNGSKEEALNLIFVPGFSTASSITDISGRGVGMDVVRGNIARLRGRMSIDSTVGKGTTFCIYLPLTLAIIDGLLVGVGNQRFIIPTLSIKESFRPVPSMLSSIKGRELIVNLRGKLIPLIQLREKLGLEDGVKNVEDGIILIINSAGQEKGLLVDQLINKQEVVIKPVGETLKHQPLYSGAAILGDGKAALILDPDILGQSESKIRNDH